MSSTNETAKRRSALLLATSILALSGSLASAQTPPTALPPVEVSPPTDPNKTRARPLEADGSGTTTRPARTARPSRGAGTGSSDGAGPGTAGAHAASRRGSAG